MTTLTVTVLLTVTGCWAARRYPGSWVRSADRAGAVVLAAVTVSWLVSTSLQVPWSPATSLPFALCDIATVVAAAALWWRTPLLVELTYFWGLAGTLQALLTPDLSVGFPSLEFFQYVIAHAGVVAAALFLVVGQGIRPRRGSVPRIFVITAVYTALVGALDAVTGGDYMFLRSRPASWTLLSVLGPWPWYVVSAAGVALVLLVVLYLPFWMSRGDHGSVP